MEEIDPNIEGSTDESGVIKALRKQIKDVERERDSRFTREDLESEFRTQLRREADTAALLTAQGHPSGLAKYMLQEIGDAEITPETVSGFLQGLGFESKPASSEGEQPASQAQQLADVTTLASRVSAAAINTPAGDVTARIAAAQNQAEVNAIMEEIGALQSS